MNARQVANLGLVFLGLVGLSLLLDTAASLRADPPAGCRYTVAHDPKGACTTTTFCNAGNGNPFVCPGLSEPVNINAPNDICVDSDGGPTSCVSKQAQCCDRFTCIYIDLNNTCIRGVSAPEMMVLWYTEDCPTSTGG
jgi:hypothetical protein